MVGVVKPQAGNSGLVEILLNFHTSLVWEQPGDCRRPVVYYREKLNQSGAQWRAKEIINGGTPGGPAARCIDPAPSTYRDTNQAGM